MTKLRKSERTSYGFVFGPLNVERVSNVEGRGVCLKVETEHKVVYIYASPAGRSLRVFENNETEMKPVATKTGRAETLSGETGRKCLACFDTGRYVDGGPCPDC